MNIVIFQQKCTIYSVETRAIADGITNFLPDQADPFRIKVLLLKISDDHEKYFQNVFFPWILPKMDLKRVECFWH